MTGGSVVVRVTTLCVLSVLQRSLISRAPGLLAVVLVVLLARCTLSTRVALGTDSDQISDLVARVLSGTDTSPDDLVTDNGGVLARAPARSQDVDVTAADSAGRDLDIDVIVFERSGSVRVLLQRKVVALRLEGSVSSELFRDGSVGSHNGDCLSCSETPPPSIHDPSCFHVIYCVGTSTSTSTLKIETDTQPASSTESTYLGSVCQPKIPRTAS